MSEIRRVYRKKTILFLLVLCVVNFALFLFCAAPDKEITLSGDKLTSYISSYPAFLARTAESGHTLASLNMYKKGYAYEVLQKSTAAYEKLEGVYPRGGDNRGIVLLLQYHITDLFLLAFLIILTADFLAERKKGLAGIVRSTPKGRGNLCLQRIGILAFSSIFGAAVLYGSNYLGMLSAYGWTDLSRCIQSLPEFMKCPYNLTIGSYLVFSVLLKALGCFTAALVFFILISLLGTATAYAGMGILTVLEVLLHLLVIPVSSVNILRYLNLYTIISCEEYFTDYCFINLFGKAVPAVSGVQVFLAALTLLLAAAGLYIHVKKYVSNRQIGERVLNKIAVIREKTAWQRTLPGWEVYKLFVKQGGVLIIAVVFCLHFYMSTRYAYSYPVDAREQLLYLKYEGDITEESFGKAQREMDMLIEKIDRYNKLMDKLELEKPVDGQKIQLLGQALLEAEHMRAALEPVLEDMRGGIGYTRQTGRTVQLILPFTYEMLFEKDWKTADRASLLILIGIIGAVSGIFAFDTENHMRDSIHTAFRGRKHTVAVKLGLIFAVCAVITVSLHIVQVWQIGSYMGYNNITAPVQSLPFMRGFRPYVSIRGYLVLLFGLRVLVAYGIGLLCGLVSRFSRDTITALGISAFLFVIPTVFAEMIPGMQNLSTIHLLGGSYFRGKEIRLEEAKPEEALSEWVYVPEYAELEEQNNYSDMRTYHDALYFPFYENHAENEENSVSEGNADAAESRTVTAIGLCRKPLPGGSEERIALEAEGNNLNTFGFTQDDCIIGVTYSWEQGEDSDHFTSWQSLIKCDPEGRLIFQRDISEVLEQEKTEYVSDIEADSQDRIYLVCGSKVLLFDAQGGYAGKVDLNSMLGSRVSSIGRGRDGKVYVCYGSFNFNLVKIDFDRKKAGEIYENFPGSGGGRLNVGMEKDFLIFDSTSVYEYSMEEERAEVLFDWLDCDVDGTKVMSLGLLSDGRIVAVSYDWDRQESSLVLLTKKHRSEVAQKETIVLGTMNNSAELKAAVVRFNRGNDRYHVTVKEYWNYYDASMSGWSDSIDKMEMDLLSDSSPDIIDLSYLDAGNLMKNGMLEDLIPYLDRSAVVSREDFADHVLDGCIFDGALAGVPKWFTVQTLIGRTSDVGTQMGWTQEEFTALADDYPDVDLINYMTKRSFLYNSLKYQGSSFINWETGECYFDTPAFIRLLEFANRFPDIVSYNSEESLPVKLQRRKVLLDYINISSFKDLQMYKAMFDADVSFVGFPTPDGSPGVDMQTDGIYAIAAKSREKEAAWEFLESYLSQEEVGRWAPGFPSLKRQIENLMREEMKIEYLTDEDGELILDDDGELIQANWLGSIRYEDGWSYQYHPVTEEEARKTMELIRTSRPNFSDDGQVSSIVSEEADYYFKGGKPAEAAADVIQKRVRLYVNENR